MLIFDLEANGLLDTVDKIHCISIHDTETNETINYNDEGSCAPISRAASYLADSDCIIGHNIIGYDLPVLSSIYSWFRPTGLCLDTLLLSRLYHADLIKVDKQRLWKHMPLSLYGSHSLEAYGYRLGVYKGCFGKTSDWAEWSQEMEDYCEQDVKVTTKLWNHFHKSLTGS